MAGAARAQRIDLVKEDDAGSRVASTLEHLANGPLALSHVLVPKTEGRREIILDHTVQMF